MIINIVVMETKQKKLKNLSNIKIIFLKFKFKFIIIVIPKYKIFKDMYALIN